MLYNDYPYTPQQRTIAERQDELQRAERAERSAVAVRWRERRQALQAECETTCGHHFAVWSGGQAICKHCDCKDGPQAEAFVALHYRLMAEDRERAIAEGFPLGIALDYSPEAREEWRTKNPHRMKPANGGSPGNLTNQTGTPDQGKDNEQR